MPTLGELQRAFRRALLEGDEAAVASTLREDGLSPGERLAVYRNNVVASLTVVLKEAFPAVCRLVDERFFDYAAHEFLRAQPPTAPCLAEYGSAFPDFLGTFPPCRHLVYLADVARLEWLMHVAAYAGAPTPLASASLRAVPPTEAPRLVLRLHPSFGFVASPWPIGRIWRANSPESPSDEAVDLDSGGAFIEVSRRDREVVFRDLPPPTFTFRAALAAGRTLEAAAGAALAKDAGFDLTQGLGDLFRDGAVVGFTIADTAS
ncbi:MAG TPA: DNA-binding domain-containing protein [Alphaproteobacteria bacterium]|nr:DNA-binding domain-containing protein [Alphaproteobacteria bacterium]